MKKRILAALMAAAMVMTLLVGCGGKEEGSSEEGADLDANVAVFYYNYADTYIAKVRTALDAQLEEMGVEFQDYDANGNQTTQNEQIDTAIQKGATMLVVNIVTTGSIDSSTQIIDKAKAADLPVIFFPGRRSGNHGHTDGDAPAVGQGELAGGLHGVAQGVAQIQKLSGTPVKLVGLHKAALAVDAGGHHLVEGQLQQVPALQNGVFQHLGTAVLEQLLGERVQQGRVADHQLGLVEGAAEIFSLV